MTQRGLLIIAVVLAAIFASYFLLPGKNRVRPLRVKQYDAEVIMAASQAANSGRNNASATPTQAVQSSNKVEQIIAQTPGQIDGGSTINVFDKAGLKQFIDFDFKRYIKEAGVSEITRTEFPSLEKNIIFKAATNYKNVTLHPIQSILQSDMNSIAKLIQKISEAGVQVVSVQAESVGYSQTSNVSILMYLYEENFYVEKGD